MAGAKQKWWIQTPTKKSFTMFTVVIWTQILSLKCKLEEFKCFASAFYEKSGGDGGHFDMFFIN